MNHPQDPSVDPTPIAATKAWPIVQVDQLRYFQHDPPWVKLSALFISCLGRILVGTACVGLTAYKFWPLLVSTGF